MPTQLSDPVDPADLGEPRRLELFRRIACLFKTYAVPAESAVLPRPFPRDDRNCFTSWLPPEWPSDERGGSPVVLHEDGLPLGPAHCSHDDIRTLGKGRYSHWGPALYFSSSDNTDPNENGRTYSIQPPEGWTGSLLPPRPVDLADGGGDGRPTRGGDRARVTWSLTDVPSASIRETGGAGFAFEVDPAWASDDGSISTLMLLEDGRPLPRPHALHAEIASLGGGRYSHWSGTVFFSASDGGDPRRNGRTYSIAHAEAMLLGHAPHPPFRDAGHCFILAAMPRHWELPDPRRSRLLVVEDGRPLGPSHASHDEIRALGGGRFSHWGAQLFFSTSDNSDPTSNGRTYTLVFDD